MSLTYQAVQWNRQKRFYDLALVSGIGLFLAAFIGFTLWRHPTVTAEIVLLRATASAAFLLLHLILAIGPLCRLQPRFLPLLYNRRHAGVALALLAVTHAALAVITYHAGGNLNPFVSVLVSERFTGSLATVPFQPFGLAALLILILMAATSHDFWLAQLTPPIWKALHQLVYVAYGLLIAHVTLGALQAETHLLPTLATGVGLASLVGLHVAAAGRERATDRPVESPIPEGYVDACAVAEIPLNRARIVCLAGERVAVFRHADGISAVSNLCQHQNGPLGEGRIIDGCITCPWHGYQYRPDTGASPPPFTERIPTFHVEVRQGRVWIHPRPNPPGTLVRPAPIEPLTASTPTHSPTPASPASPPLVRA